MIEQDIQALTSAIRDLIATLQERPASAPVAEVITPAELVAPSAVEPPAAPAQETKRRGRPPKKIEPAPAEEFEAQAEAEAEAEAEAKVEVPEADDFSDSTEVVEEVVTVDTVRAAIRDIIIAGGKDREDVTRKHIVRILANYNNAKTLPELPPEVFPKVLAAIRAIPV